METEKREDLEIESRKEKLENTQVKTNKGHVGGVLKKEKNQGGGHGGGGGAGRRDGYCVPCDTHAPPRRLSFPEFILLIIYLQGSLC